MEIKFRKDILALGTYLGEKDGYKSHLAFFNRLLLFGQPEPRPLPPPPRLGVKGGVKKDSAASFLFGSGRPLLDDRFSRKVLTTGGHRFRPFFSCSGLCRIDMSVSTIVWILRDIFLKPDFGGQLFI